MYRGIFMIARPKRQSAVFVQDAAQALLDAGYGHAAVFRGTGFTRAVLAEDEPHGDGGAIAQFFEHAADLAPDMQFGFSLGQRADLRRFGLWGYGALTAPDLEQALKMLVEQGHHAFGDLTWTLTEMDEGVGLSAALHHSHPGATPERQQYDEFLASLILTALRTASAQHLIPLRVSFAHPQRAGVLPDMAAFFGCTPQFGAAALQLIFARSDLARPLISADPILHRMLRDYAKRLNEQGNENGLVQQVEQAISLRLSSGEASLAEVAEDLGMSARSLSRKLAAREQSFFAILERLRHDLAIQYLFNSDLVLAEIAHALGYSGLSSFNDAFKRWTGQSPGQFRQRREGEDDG